MSWDTYIGLEVHIQLTTKSKLFSNSPTDFGALPNTQASRVDLGIPGTLPVLNKEAVAMAVKLGLSIDATIDKTCSFARKNYFYPDSPKNYQITQHNHPIVSSGLLKVRLRDDEVLTVPIERAHLEEDAGKSIHDLFSNQTALDYNRAGNPLIEIVSAPVLRSAEQAVAYLKTLHTLVRYLGICDGNMQEGSFRCDANVSICPSGSKTLGKRAEIKNLNSFRFIEKAINYEVNRQIDVLESGGKLQQETRLYDPSANETRFMRLKEEAHHYRYFPEPDLLPLKLTDALIQSIQETLPELPWEKRKRFIEQYALNASLVEHFVDDEKLADYFEETVKHSKGSPILAANWVTGELSATFNKESTSVENSKINPSDLAGLLKRIEDHTISGKIAKDVFSSLWEHGGTADSIIEGKNLKQITDTSALTTLVDKILSENNTQLQAYKAGKIKLFGYFVGQVMKESKGKANPAQVNAILKEKLSK